MTGPVCGNGMCDRPAVASLYHHGSLLVRADHFHRVERAEAWRCLDCLHDDLDAWLAGELPRDVPPEQEDPSCRSWENERDLRALDEETS